MQHSTLSIKAIPYLSVIIIGISIFLHGHVGWNIWISSPPHYYPLDFKKAEWVGINNNLPQGYYRKEIYINEQIRNAWLKIAASDSYQLYVNGKPVGQEIFSSTEVTGIYDITGNFIPGKNVIAVCVRRFNMKETNKLMVELGYEDVGGIKRSIVSDNTWKVASVEEWQVHGEILWNSVDFNDSGWKHVTPIDNDHEEYNHFVAINPVLIEKPVESNWLWGTDPSINSVILQYPFSISSKGKDAWLRIAMDGRYQLYLNGQKIGGNEVSTGYLDIYNITPFIKKGENEITITAYKELSSRGILMDGFVLSGDQIYNFTDNNWRITTLNNKTYQHVTSISPYNIQSDGIFTKRFIDPSFTGTFRLQNFLKQFLWLLLTGLIWVSVWIGSSFFIQRLCKITLGSALLIDSIAHLPSILFLGTLYLLKFDINHNISFPYQQSFILISILLIFLFKLVFILERYLKTDPQINSPPVMGEDKEGDDGRKILGGFTLDKITIIVLFLLVIIGGILRVKGLDYQSLYHDEIHMTNYTQGIFEEGYPYKMIGPVKRPLATYELLPYPMALSTLLLGANDFAFRLPSAIFGILTIVLIYYVSATLLDKWVAILASAIYTFLPPAIVWAQYLFHPQQAQFFALLTSFFFYKAIEKEVINRRYLYSATASYVLLYLTWEGTGFFLGALFLGLLFVRGRNFEWIKDKSLWTAVGVIVGLIFVQLVRRFLLQIPYLVVGSGNSEITGPSLFFLSPMYDPYFYIKNFLWREYNFVLTFLCIIGIPFLKRFPLLRYYYALVFAPLFLMTNLFAANALRYAIYLEPFLIISAIAAGIYMGRFVLQSLTIVMPGTLKVKAYIIFLPIVGILCIGTNDYFYKFYRLAYSPLSLGAQWRSNLYYVDFRSPIQFMANNYRKGDLVISTFPYATKFYSDIETDYFLESITVRQMVYDITEESPLYLDRTIGTPTLRGFSEFNDISNRYQRIWIVAIPYTVFQRMIDEDVQEHLTKNAKVVYESYNARVYLIGI